MAGEGNACQKLRRSCGVTQRRRNEATRNGMMANKTKNALESSHKDAMITASNSVIGFR